MAWGVYAICFAIFLGNAYSSPTLTCREGEVCEVVFASDGQVPQVEAPSGAAVTVVYQGYHNLYRVNSKEALDACDWASSGQLVYGPQTGGTRAVTAAEGTSYYVCGIGSHCQAGAKFVITGVSVAPPPASPPPPSPPPPSPPPPMPPLPAPVQTTHVPPYRKKRESSIQAHGNHFLGVKAISVTPP